MPHRLEPVHLEGPAGPLEAVMLVPGTPRPGAALLCHPHPQHGGTMHTKALVHAARALLFLGLPVLRFHFRGVGRSAGTFGGGHGKREDARSALAWLATRHAGEPLLVGGFSFGCWIASQVAGARDDVAGLVGIAPPLAVYDFDFLAPQGPPFLGVAGDRDPFCPAPLLEDLGARLGARARIVRLAGAEHLLATHLVPLAAAVRDFASECLSQPRWT